MPGARRNAGQRNRALLTTSQIKARCGIAAHDGSPRPVVGEKVGFPATERFAAMLGLRNRDLGHPGARTEAAPERQAAAPSGRSRVST